MAIELGAAYVMIIPSLKGAARQITAELGGVDTGRAGSRIGEQLSGDIGRGLNLQTVAAKLQGLGGEITKVGDRFTSIGSSLTSGITKPALAAGGAVAGLIGALGFKRLVGIDTARGQFQGLGYDADAVMAQVDRGVTNTSLSMAQGASLAVGVLATGAIPLGQLEEQIKRVANVSAAYNVDAEHAAYLLNNVLVKQKVTWGDLAQMQQNNIPVVTALADYFGVAGDAIEDMAARGEISIDDLNAALDSKAGAAAEAYAGTWAGITANIKSNLGKIGAAFGEEAFENIKVAGAELLEWLRSPELTETAREWGAKFGEAVSSAIDGVKSLIGWWQGLSPEMQGTIGRMAGIAIAAGPVLMIVGRIISGIGGLVTGIGTVVGWFGTLGTAGAAGAGTAATATAGAGAAAATSGGLMGKLGGIVRGLFGPIGLIIGLIAAVIAASPELQATLGEAFSQIGAAIGEVIAVLAPLIAQIVSALLPVFQRIVEAVAPIIATLVEALVPIIVMVIGLVADIIVALMPLIELIISLLLPIIESILDTVTVVFDAIMPIIEGALTYIQGIIQFWTGLISGDWDQVWQGIRTMAQGIWDMIVGIITGAFEIIKHWITTSLKNIQDVWNFVWGHVSSFLGDTWNNIRARVTQALTTVRSIIDGALNWISSTWNNVWSTVSNFMSTIWRNITTGIRGGWDGVASFLGSIPSRVMNFFSGIGTWLLESGKSLLDGFVSGIRSGFDAAVGAVKDGLDWVRGFFPFSPAKEGPFSGRGWVSYAGLSVGETFAEQAGLALTSGADDVRAGMTALHREFGGIEMAAQVRSTLQVQGGDLAPAARPVVINVEHMSVDDDNRVEEVAEQLYELEARARRARGEVDLEGAVT